MRPSSKWRRHDEVRVTYKDHTGSQHRTPDFHRERCVESVSLDNIITDATEKTCCMAAVVADQFFGGAGRDTVVYGDSTDAMNIH